MININKTWALTFYYDAGHGWLAAPLTLIKALNLQEKISKYSYFKKSTETVYLEEDCDAALLLNALKRLNIKHNITDVDHGNKSEIRNYGRCE